METIRSRGSRPAPWHDALLLVVVGAAAYSNSFQGAFVFDDLRCIVHNEDIRSFTPLSNHLNSRPLLFLSLATNYRLGGLNVAGYHAVNLLVHLAAGLVLFGLVLRALCTKRLRRLYGEAATWLAFIVAALWLAHPLQTQAVTYVIQRAESMAGIFYLLVLYCLHRSHGAKRNGTWQAAGLLACLFGML